MKDETKDQHFSLIVNESTYEANTSSLAMRICFSVPKKAAIVTTSFSCAPYKRYCRKCIKDCKGVFAGQFRH